MISRWFISSLLRQHQLSGISTLEKTFDVVISSLSKVYPVRENKHAYVD